MHPGDNETKNPSLQPFQRDAPAFKVCMPCMLEVVLVNGIVDHPEAVQFIIANRHFYLEMRFTTGWLHLVSEFRQEACVESGGFRGGRHYSCFRACRAESCRTHRIDFSLHFRQLFLTLANHFLRINGTVQFITAF